MVKTIKTTCKLSQQQLVDEYFLEYRARILDLAAYLDRLDRACEKDADDEFRYTALLRSLRILSSEEPAKTKRVQMVLSDQDVSLLEDRDQQSAFGASSRTST